MLMITTLKTNFDALCRFENLRMNFLKPIIKQIKSPDYVLNAANEIVRSFKTVFAQTHDRVHVVFPI